MENDTDYFISDQPVTFPTATAQECSKFCADTYGCTIYTYNQGGCYFKNQLGTKQYSKGRTSGICKKPASKNVLQHPGCADPTCLVYDISGAVNVAAQADVTIVILGLDTSLESEGHDRSSTILPAGQLKLVQALRSATIGKPMIGVFIHGGTFSMKGVEENLDGIVDALYPGMQGGSAISDVIFGYYNPGGRVAVTWYKNDEDVPRKQFMSWYHGKGASYRFFNGEPQYPFGYGLSYTTFRYSNLKYTPKSVFNCPVVEVSFDITNTGNVDGDEVAQLYLTLPDATVPNPNIRLAAFDRFHILAGETRSVRFVLTPEEFTVVYETKDIYDGNVVVEKGNVHFFVGGGQPKYFPNHLIGFIEILTTSTLKNCGCTLSWNARWECDCRCTIWIL